MTESERHERAHKRDGIYFWLLMLLVFGGMAVYLLMN